MERLKEIIFYPWQLRERKRQERVREANRLHEQSKRSQREINELLQTLVAAAEAAEDEGKRVIKHIPDSEFSEPATRETFVNFQSILPEQAPLVSLSAGVDVDAEGYVNWHPYLTLVFKGGRTFHAHSFLTDELKQPEYGSKQPINFWREINEETKLSRWWRREHAGTVLGNCNPETYLESILGRMEHIDEVLNLLRQSATLATSSNT